MVIKGHYEGRTAEQREFGIWEAVWCDQKGTGLWSLTKNKLQAKSVM